MYGITAPIRPPRQHLPQDMIEKRIGFARIIVILTRFVIAKLTVANVTCPPAKAIREMPRIDLPLQFDHTFAISFNLARRSAKQKGFTSRGRTGAMPSTSA